MSHNTHSTVGQNAGQCVVLRASVELEAANPPSPVPCPPSPRRGISLTEVLIAMGILTVGLLGVAAIFPVAGFYMQKGEVADRGSALAQSAFNELLTRGMLNPELWQVMVPVSPGNQPNTWFNADLKTAAATPFRGTFTRPFAAALREAQAKNFSPSDISRNFGGGFVIDPIGVGAFAATPGEGDVRLNRLAMPFPSSFVNWFQAFTTTGYPWSPWSGLANSPLRRVTFRNATTGWQLSDVMADNLFRTSDDLSLELPVGQDKPSKQPIDLGDLNGDNRPNEPLARRSRGEYSWLATVVPSTPEGLLALANGPGGNAYEVSVVVFHKRALPNDLPAADGSDFFQVAAEERMSSARIVSTGLSGGEVLLERHGRDDPAVVSEGPFDNLKSGQWIALCGPHPSSTDARPLFVARWYKVLSVEGKRERLNANGTISPPPGPSEPERRLVSLRGPQWPWQPAANLTDPSHLSNNLCASIIPGAVAVHARTIQIEGESTWSGGAEGLATSPTYVSPIRN